jgi:Flp pilus assembly protein TadD
MSQGNYTGAIDAFDKALQINPTDNNALIGKGLSLANLGKYNESITLIKRCKLIQVMPIL